MQIGVLEKKTDDLRQDLDRKTADLRQDLTYRGGFAAVLATLVIGSQVNPALGNFFSDVFRLITSLIK